MKKLITTLLALSLLTAPAPATPPTDLVIQTNATFVGLGDSYWQGGLAPRITGYRYLEYLDAALKLRFPQKHINFFNGASSGVKMDDIMTNGVPGLAIPLWGYLTNGNQKIGLLLGTDNSDLSSNQMYLANSNIFLAPHLMSDGDANLITHSGWCDTGRVDWVGVGYPTGMSTDGSPLTEGARNDASTNAGWTLGVRGIDSWHILANGWTNDFILHAGLWVGWITNGQSIGHFFSGGALDWTYATLQQIIPSYLNISSCVIDYGGAGAVVSTNGCYVTSVTRSGSTLTFNKLDDALPPVWDNPGDVVADGIITNDANHAFDLRATNATMFKFSIQITNLPAGNYYLAVDGEVIATMPHTALTNVGGYNMATNMVGPDWRKRVKVLADIRRKDYINQVSLIPGSAGDSQGLVSFGSQAHTKFATFKGDALIAAVAATGISSNVFYLDSLAISDAQPVMRTYTIGPVATFHTVAPFIRR